MKRTVQSFFALATLSLFSVYAQEPQSKQQPKNDSGPESSPAVRNQVAPVNQRGVPSRDGAEEPIIHDFDFDGGTVQELIQVLREAGRKAGLSPLNVIVTDDMQQQTVPRLELHNVRYADILQALNQLNNNGANGQWQLSTTGESSIWVLNRGAFFPAANQIDPLTGLPITPGAPPPEPPKNCQVYQLLRYLTKYKVEDITTAVHTAWGMVGIEKGAELKYHKDTSLLIAVGRPNQLELITRVLHSLDEGLALPDNAKNIVAEVFVNGAVNHPGSIILPPDGQDLDIVTAIARAGGLSTRANESKIRFTRPGISETTYSWEQLKKGPKYNLSLKPGDIIEVAEKLF